MEEINLSESELKRYARQLSLREIGAAGQHKIKAAKVLIVGVGGLGCPASMYLAAAGVGTIGLVENDVVEESNLQRQVLFNSHDIGRKKIDVASEKLKLLNPHLDVKKFDVRLHLENSVELISQFDIVIDGTDNLSSKYLINDICHVLGKPLVYASINQFDGQLAIFNLGCCEITINYRDLFPSPPPSHLVPSCAEAGVIGVLPGLLGCMQANETIKLICEIPSGLNGKLLCIDSISMETRLFNVKCDPSNPLRRADFALHDVVEIEEACDVSNFQKLDTDTFMTWLASDKPFLLIDVRTEQERQQISFGGKHIPLAQLTETSFDVPAGMSVIFYCASGKRSAHACLSMSDAQKSFFSLNGGTEELLKRSINAEQIASNFDPYGVLLAKQFT